MLVAVGAVLLSGLLGGAFAAGRSTQLSGARPDPLALQDGFVLGVSQSRAGAIAAADNYVATAVTSSLDPKQLQRFADVVVDPAARAGFMAAGRSALRARAPGPGTHAVASVIAHRLDGYGAATAVVSVWVLADYWDGGLAPMEFSAIVHVSLRWSGERWEIVAVREVLPGPVPALTAEPVVARTAGFWDHELSGMSAAYYGDS